MRRLFASVLLGVLLLLCSPALSQAAVVHGTDAEIAIWKARTVSGPYKSDWDVILKRAETFRARPSTRWRGVTNGCYQGNALSIGLHRELDMGLRDAAFVCLLRGGQDYFQAVRTALLAQTREAGTNFANTRTWCTSPADATTQGVGNGVGVWLRRLAYAYSYIQADLSPADRATLDAWFTHAGVYLQTVLDVVVQKRFPHRLRDDYTPLPPSGAVRGRTHAGGPQVYAVMDAWNNEGTGTVAALAVLGRLLNNPTMQSHAARYVREWLAYGTFPGGHSLEEARWAYGATTGTPQHGYLYTGVTLGSIITAMDALARDGGVNLFDYTTTAGMHGTQGAKSVRAVLEHFADLSHGTVQEYAAASKGDPADLIDPVGPRQTRIEYIWLAHGNLQYQDASIKAAYQRPIPSRYDTSGCDMLGSDWCHLPGVRFMYGDLEGQVAPYGPQPASPPPIAPPPPAPDPPPSAPPPTPPPHAADCNLDLAWEYPQLLHPQTQYELHVVTVVQGRPTAHDQAVVALAVEGCPLTLTPDGWQAVCTCVCLAAGDYALSVRAKQTDVWSAPSNILDFTFTPQDSCAPPITIPMVPPPPPAKDPGPKPGEVIGPVVGGAVVVGGAAAVAGGTGTLSIPGLVNRECVDWAITGVCACGFPPKPCTQVSYNEPAWILEVVKRPGTSKIPVLGQLLYAALQATGVPAFGGGGSGNASGSGHTNIHFSEVHVWSFPQVLGGPCGGCVPTAALPVLHYASEMDAVPWRTSTAPPMPPPALLPVGVWGMLFPRSGHVIHGSPPVASGLVAFRALTIAFKPVTPLPVPDAHVITTPSRGITTCFQLASPRMTKCFDVGLMPPLWETATGSPDGTFVWLGWRRRTCCVEPALSTCGITLPGIGGHGGSMCTMPSFPLP